MRLICPNCGAQYEVADDVIPEAGRDVQCSNCGHTWFEEPAGPSSPSATPASPFADALLQSRQQRASGGAPGKGEATGGRPRTAPYDASATEPAEDDGAAGHRGAPEGPGGGTEPVDGGAPEWPGGGTEAGAWPPGATAPTSPAPADPGPSGAATGDAGRRRTRRAPGPRPGGAWMPPHVGAPARPEAPKDRSAETAPDAHFADPGRTVPGADGAEDAPPAPRDAAATGPGEAPDAASDRRADPAAEPPEAPASAPPPGVRRRITPEIAEILRTEAAREEAVRRAEAGVLESQPDLGLDLGGPPAPKPRSEAPQARGGAGTDRPGGDGAPAASEGRAGDASRGTADSAAAAGDSAPGTPAARRELLPDIEEINSTLRPTTERPGLPDRGTPEAEAARQRSGFRTGFAFVLLVAAGLALAYAAAPEIAGLVPAAEATLAEYTAAVDAARLWLDRQMQDLLAFVAEAG